MIVDEIILPTQIEFISFSFQHAMSVIGFTKEVINDVMQVVAAILIMGNIQFEALQKKGNIDSRFAVLGDLSSM